MMQRMHMKSTGRWLGAALLLVANLAFADKPSITDSKAFVDCMSSDYVGAGPNTYRIGCIKAEIKKYQTFSLVLSSKSFQYTPVGIIQGFEHLKAR